jgi:hypothetical protein
LANAVDVVLVAGKGHEPQEIAGKKLPFSDAFEVQQASLDDDEFRSCVAIGGTGDDVRFDSVSTDSWTLPGASFVALRGDARRH